MRIFERNDEILLCTFEEIFVFSSKDEFKQSIDPDFDPESFHIVNHEIFVNQLEKGLSTINGQIAIGTPNEVLFILNSRDYIELHLNKAAGIENRTMLSIFEGAHGNL